MESMLSPTNSGSGLVQLKDVVEVLNDPYFIANWKTFYKELNAPHPNFLQLEKWFAAGFKEWSEILVEILGHWVISHWGEATVEKLLHILRKGNFRKAAEILEEKFSPSSTIIMTKSKLSFQISMQHSEDDSE